MILYKIVSATIAGTLSGGEERSRKKKKRERENNRKLRKGKKRGNKFIIAQPVR